MNPPILNQLRPRVVRNKTSGLEILPEDAILKCFRCQSQLRVEIAEFMQNQKGMMHLSS
jgi:hypothetical protein